jgi:hypothetical protein
MTALGAARFVIRRALQSILERKFHFLTIGNLCAVVSENGNLGGVYARRSKALAGCGATPKMKA